MKFLIIFLTIVVHRFVYTVGLFLSVSIVVCRFVVGYVTVKPFVSFPQVTIDMCIAVFFNADVI